MARRVIRCTLWQLVGARWVLTHAWVALCAYVDAQGSLRDQLLYPHTTASRYDDGNDGELVRLLQEVDLGHLLACKGGLDAEEVWQDMLSVGEQQRIGFIRLLYHRCVDTQTTGACVSCPHSPYDDVLWFPARSMPYSTKALRPWMWRWRPVATACALRRASHASASGTG